MGSEREESSGTESYEDSGSEFSDDEFEPVDEAELGEGEGTRGLSDILSAVGVDVGGQKKVLRDAMGNPIQPVMNEEGKYETPTLVDQEGNVVHKGMSTGKKVALGAGGLALLAGGAAAAAGVTAVGVHYYRKKQGGEGKKKKEGKKEKGDKKDKKDKKDKEGKKDKKDKGDKKEKKDKKDKKKK